MAYSPRFRITPELLALIAEASELKSWIDLAVIDVAWLPRLQQQTAARLAHSSTSIEGNPLSFPEVEALARGEAISAPQKATAEVMNYLIAMRWIWKRAAKTHFDEKELLQLHKLLVQRVLPPEQTGRYKEKSNRVVDGRGHILYTPPPPEKAKSLTVELLHWLGSKDSARLHPIITSAIAHHRLVSIHPFTDGNGRISRAFAIWILYVRGFDTHHLFALDEYYEQDRKKYYDKIQQARELDDDLTYWLEYAANGVVQTLKQTRERITSLDISFKTQKITLTRRQEDMLRFLRDRGRAKSPDFEKAFHCTRSRVNQILQPLIKAGLVLREGETRATTYRLAKEN